MNGDRNALVLVWCMLNLSRCRREGAASASAPALTLITPCALFSSFHFCNYPSCVRAAAYVDMFLVHRKTSTSAAPDKLIATCFVVFLCKLDDEEFICRCFPFTDCQNCLLRLTSDDSAFIDCFSVEGNVKVKKYVR